MKRRCSKKKAYYRQHYHLWVLIARCPELPYFGHHRTERFVVLARTHIVVHQDLGEAVKAARPSARKRGVGLSVDDVVSSTYVGLICKRADGSFVFGEDCTGLRRDDTEY